MAEMINYGIDLGTTNSLIARFNRGTVEVFKNPNGFKETLPSIVGFRNDRILVGDQAKTYAERDPKSVASRFKRKMGTTETIKIKAINALKSPVELSAFVLKELKSFIHTGEIPEAVVITIPASFDTVQSNATKEAGFQAGFKQVILLQEPIAASLAFANKEKAVDLKNSQWIVYDLGGGTFDVALIRIVEGELKVIDHEGDNYLGGGDFDAVLVENIIVPELSKIGRFADFMTNLKSESGKYNRLWAVLLSKAEDAKIELSSRQSAEIDLGTIRDLKDDDGKTIDAVITITRSEFDAAIKGFVEATASMVKSILTRNSLQASDVEFVLMVGGSTYIPYVRKRIEEILDIPVNTGVDPTNAIAVGAAYFAATKEAKAENAIPAPPVAPGALRVRASYSRATQEMEELFSAKVEGAANGLFYRIVRRDNAYDSGLKKLTNRIVEELPLQQNAFNIFSFQIFDSQNSAVSTDFEVIEIAQGKYTVAGQVLPEDICLVKDDALNNDTKLDPIFKKNTILPAKTKKSVEVGKSISKGADDELRIMVVEGPAENHSTTNKPIGLLLIPGKQITRDLLRGTGIDLTFELSESRDLTVHAYLDGTNQEFKEVFDPKPRDVPMHVLTSEVELLEARFQAERREAEETDNKEVVEELEKLEKDVESLTARATLLSIDDVTDDRFKFEDQKRRIAQRIYQVTAGKKLEAAKGEYAATKQEVADLVRRLGTSKEQQQFEEQMGQDFAVTVSNNLERVRAANAALDRIQFQILERTPEFLMGMFGSLAERRSSMNNPSLADNLIETGRLHIQKEERDALRMVVMRLWDLIPEQARTAAELRQFTGIV
jgi:molecular chaperone DnaK